MRQGAHFFLGKAKSLRRASRTKTIETWPTYLWPYSSIGLNDDAHFSQYQLFGKFFIIADKATLPERWKTASLQTYEYREKGLSHSTNNDY
jgi:hypothetical protein